MKRRVCLLLFAIVLLACAPNPERQRVEPKILRVSVLPDESREKLLERYTPLVEYLAQELGMPYRLIIPKDYDELLNLFHGQEIDLAYFGGFTFMKAHIADQAEPLVMRDVDTRFTSYFLARAADPGQEIADFKGRTFAFGSDLSTSGHLMPRFFLYEMGMVPETFFGAVRYSGKHDLTAYWVRDGEVDLGVANHAVIDQMYQDGRLHPDEVRILYETPPYPDYVWALQPRFTEAFRIKLRNAFLGLAMTDARQAAILAGVDAGAFLPAGMHDFAKLEKVMTGLARPGRK